MKASDWKVVRITYWIDHVEFSVWWFSDQVEDAMRSLGAERWRVPG